MAAFRIGALQLLNICAYLMMIIFNGLADLIPIGGNTSAEVTVRYSNYFLPASITFLIWALIHLLLLLFCIYQAGTLFQQKKTGISNKEIVAAKIGMLFILSCLLNSSWLLAWHFQQLGLSVIIMIMLLITLILIHHRLSIAIAPADENERTFVWLPFSIYLGWVSVACMANIAAWLVSVGWNGFGITQSWWAIALIILGTLISVLMLFKRHNIFFGLTVIWALAGIALRQFQETGKWNNVALAALLSSFLLMILIVFTYRSLSKVKTA